MKDRFENQHQTWTPTYPAQPETRLPNYAPPRSNWQRYLDGDWNPFRKQPEPTTESSIKCNH